MKSAIAILFVCLLILCADTITGAELGAPTWRLGRETGNMRDCLVTVPVTKVDGRESITCTVHVIGANGQELASGMLSDILEAPGKVSRSFQIRGADASTIVRVTVDR